MIILRHRHRAAERLDGPRQKTSHPALLARLNKELAPFDALMEQPWFEGTGDIVGVPRLSDFLNREQVDKLFAQQKHLRERQYDEKFHILQAPTLLIPDLDYYREVCARRSAPVALAYLDIDDFKKNFNAKYGEVTIDVDVLPLFMRALEAFAFIHGYACRFGGDECAILLPHMTQARAVADLDGLRQKLKGLSYRGVSEVTSVSIGLCVLPPDSYLTSREALERANFAKNRAKDAGKDRIATYSGEFFRDSDLIMAAEK